MPDIVYREINSEKFYCYIDGDWCALIKRHSDGLWYLSFVESDGIEIAEKKKTLLNNGDYFSGGTVDEAKEAFLSDYFAGSLDLSDCG